MDSDSGYDECQSTLRGGRRVGDVTEVEVVREEDIKLATITDPRAITGARKREWSLSPSRLRMPTLKYTGDSEATAWKPQEAAGSNRIASNLS